MRLNEVYYWKVSEINTIPNMTSATTTYKVTVAFQKNNPNEIILAWMWWSAKIILSKIENVLLVPSQAVTTISWQNMVMLKKWEQWIESPVEIWDSDETNTEIISWLKAWDIVKTMFFSTEAMIERGLSTEASSLDLSDDKAVRQNAKDSMSEFSRWAGWGWNRWWMWWWGFWWGF